MQNVNEVSLTDLTAEIAVGVRRAEVVAKLQTAEEPLTVAQVANRTGLHVNTARFHLDGLVADHLATRTVEARATPGRPRILYRIRLGGSGPRSFGLLAEMLAGLVASLEGARGSAIEVGRTWGRNLVDRVAPLQPLDLDAALETFKELLNAVGFQPEIITSSGDSVEVHLHHCPFREVAETHTEIVCALHLGLMQGALSELRAPLQAESLKAFVTPNLCTAPLRLLPADTA
jgi:predicted ArsR family transcriptional regulator